MKIEAMKPGQVVWDVHRYKMGNTTLWTMGTWAVHIVSIDLERRKVVASWNTNAAQVYSERTWKKWKAKKPLLVRANTLGQRRLATKEEKAAHEAKQAEAAAGAA